jgi:hypothetical protein
MDGVVGPGQSRGRTRSTAGAASACRYRAQDRHGGTIPPALSRNHPTMASVLAFIKKADVGAVFDDHATKAMGEAFDAACKDLHDRGQPSIVYGVIANRIIEAARSGERDPHKLKETALMAFSGKRH